MTIKDQVNNDLKAALLGGDHFLADTLRGIKAVILNEEVAQNKRDVGLDEKTTQQILSREVKKRNESAEIYENASRPELAEKERAEVNIISGYLPEQLSEDEITQCVNRMINQLGAQSPSDMGKVIGAVKMELGESADGSVIARIVKEALNQNK